MYSWSSSLTNLYFTRRKAAIASYLYLQPFELWIEMYFFFLLDPVTSTSSSWHAYFNASSWSSPIVPSLASWHRLCTWNTIGWSVSIWLSTNSCNVLKFLPWPAGFIVTFKIFSFSLYTLSTMRFWQTAKKNFNLQSAWRYAIHVVGITSHQLVFLHVYFHGSTLFRFCASLLNL